MSFKRFDTEDIVISAEIATIPVWSGDLLELASFATNSTQIAETGKFYYDVYNTTGTSGRVQFALAYANKSGSYGTLYNSEVSGSTPTSTIYGQYRTLVLGDEESNFTFGGVESEHFYVISIDRARYREKLAPGSFELKLTHSGSLSLIDDSRTRLTDVYTDVGRVYEIVSGSAGVLYTGSNATGYSASGSYGKFLPDIGTILLNANALALATGEAGGISLPLSGTTSAGTIVPLLNAMTTGASFKLRAEETITSNYIFVRARNSEFNYSLNPSMVSDTGELSHTSMINSPQTYVTTVGLYNDNNDLLAVAKLSRSLVKDFTKEVLIRIKLDY